MYTLVLQSKARKEFNKLERDLQARILVVLDQLTLNPFQGKVLKGNLKGLYSTRVWPYRIIYEIRKQELVILVVEIIHRKDAYR